MSGNADAQAQARNPAINAYSTSSCPRVSWQILNFQIRFLRVGMISCSILGWTNSGRQRRGHTEPNVPIFGLRRTRSFATVRDDCPNTRVLESLGQLKSETQAPKTQKSILKQAGLK
jgi:hypothetical protein